MPGSMPDDRVEIPGRKPLAAAAGQRGAAAALRGDPAAQTAGSRRAGPDVPRPVTRAA